MVQKNVPKKVILSSVSDGTKMTNMATSITKCSIIEIKANSKRSKAVLLLINLPFIFSINRDINFHKNLKNVPAHVPAQTVILSSVSDGTSSHHCKAIFSHFAQNKQLRPLDRL